MSLDALKTRLIAEEGLRLKPYRDGAGKLTLGVGRNLDDVGISREEALMLLDHDLARTAAEVDRRWPWAVELDAIRREALIDMAFNLGPAKLATFARLLAALQAHRWDEAADAMAASLWARQVGARAARLAAMVRTGIAP